MHPEHGKAARRHAGRTNPKPPLRARRRLWASGAAAALVVAAFGALGVRPMLSARTDERKTNGSLRTTAEITALVAAVNEWQVYIQPHYSDFSAKPARIDATDLANGAVLAQKQQDFAVSLVATLRSQGFAENANELAAANTSYASSIAKFALLDGGAPAAVIEQTIATESSAFDRMLVVAASASHRLDTQTAAGFGDGVARLDRSRTIFAVADALVAVLVVAGAIGLGQRARRRERAEREVADRQVFEKTLQDALEMAKTEAEAYSVMTEALQHSVPRLHVQMLVAESSRAHFHLMLDSGTANRAAVCSGCAVSVPSDCPATRRSHALLFPTSQALNACPHLKGRDCGPLSAACIPVSLTGGTVGVVHATGPDGEAPTENETHYLATTSRLASERIAMIRAFERSEAQARTDPLTGLLNRRSFENRIHELERQGTPYALAYGDLDHFKVLNDTHGHEAGDQALRLFSRVLLDTLRPDDIAARYGGEEFVVVLPNCAADTAAGVLERVREHLALALTSGRVAAFTVSFGLASSAGAESFDEVLATADGALLDAKASGRNRVLLAVRPTIDLART